MHFHFLFAFQLSSVGPLQIPVLFSNWSILKRSRTGQSFRCLNNSLSMFLLVIQLFFFFVGLKLEEQLIALLVNFGAWACQLMTMGLYLKRCSSIPTNHPVATRCEFNLAILARPSSSGLTSSGWFVILILILWLLRQSVSQPAQSSSDYCLWKLSPGQISHIENANIVRWTRTTI